MTIGVKSSRAKAALIGLAISAVPTAVLAAPADAYFERAFVVAADARCDLFQPQVGQALSAAAAQARGAALRSGLNEAEVAQIGARARARAQSVSCGDADLATVRGRVNNAFAGWTRTPRMTFSGDWAADRTGYSRPTWKLMQQSQVGASPVRFGLTGQNGSYGATAVVSFVGRPRPVSARIVMRDPAKASRAWLAGDGLAPAASRTSFWSSGYEAADRVLLAEDRSAGEAWRFPAAAVTALERLDPRETFAVEFHFRDGTVATARFEAGDFAAGRAFLAMGSL